MREILFAMYLERPWHVQKFFHTHLTLHLQAQEALDPTKLYITEVVKHKQGTALALSPLYMACAKNLGVPLRTTNVTSQMKDPFDFLMVSAP